jgi:ABC-type phosphate transport system substrate-binding protein
MKRERSRFSLGFVLQGRRLPGAIAAIIAVTCLGAAPEGGAGFRMIVNEGNPVTSMSAGDVSALFLKRVTRWPNGAAARAVDLVGESATRDAFSRAMHGRSVAAIKGHWMQMVFSGRGVPPPELTEPEVLQAVRSEPGAVGYVSPTASTVGVKTITVKFEGR